MAPKRKNEEQSSARDRKKQRIAENRTIAVQPPAPAQAPSISANAAAGPSKSVAFSGNEDSIPSSYTPLTVLHMKGWEACRALSTLKNSPRYFISCNDMSFMVLKACLGQSLRDQRHAGGNEQCQVRKSLINIRGVTVI